MESKTVPLFIFSRHQKAVALAAKKAFILIPQNESSDKDSVKINVANENVSMRYVTQDLDKFLGKA